MLAYLAAKELSRYRTPIYPLTLVFVNTGLEYPEIQHFANDYVAWLQRQFTRIDVQLVRLRPKMNIRQVLTKYGYPVIGKKTGALYPRFAKRARAKRCNGQSVSDRIQPGGRLLFDDETGGQVALSQGCAVPH